MLAFLAFASCDALIILSWWKRLSSAMTQALWKKYSTMWWKLGSSASGMPFSRSGTRHLCCSCTSTGPVVDSGAEGTILRVGLLRAPPRTDPVPGERRNVLDRLSKFVDMAADRGRDGIAEEVLGDDHGVHAHFHSFTPFFAALKTKRKNKKKSRFSNGRINRKHAYKQNRKKIKAKAQKT